MSDDNDNVTKLVIFTLGIATIGLFAYLIYKEYRGYHMGGYHGGKETMSLADDNLFSLERKIHQLEMERMERMDRPVRNVRTIQPIKSMDQSQYSQSSQLQSNEYLQTPDAPPGPRKVVSMNIPNVPNMNSLSKADQDKIRRMFFNML